jgi:uncharacterized OB-fold protein
MTDAPSHPSPFHLPDGAPAPAPDADDAGFWVHVGRRELAFRGCDACGRHHHPPLPVCPHCSSRALGWTRSNGAGAIYSFTIVRHAMDDGVRDAIPYFVVLVALDAPAGVRLLANLIDAVHPPRIGDRVSLAWRTRPDGIMLPAFRPA